MGKVAGVTTGRLLGGLVAAIWVVVLVGGAFRPQGFVPAGLPRPDVGYLAPDVELVGPNLEPMRLSDLRGQAVFLNLWASWCGPCRMEMPEMQRLQESLPPGTAILAVNMTAQEASPEVPLAYLKEHGFTFPVALDPTGRAGREYRAVSLPTSLFISPDGVVTARISGPLSLHAMRGYLEAAAAAGAGATGPGAAGATGPGAAGATGPGAGATGPGAGATGPGAAGGLAGLEGLRRLTPGTWLPDVLLVGPATLPTAALAWLLGGVLAYGLGGWRTRRAGLDGTVAQDLVLNLGLGAILGAKLLYVVLDPLTYVGSPSLLLVFPYGPLALPGAAAGALALAAWGLRRAQQRTTLLDAVVPALVLGSALGVAGSTGPGAWALWPGLLAASLAGLAMRTTRLTAQTVGPAMRSVGEERSPGTVATVTLALAALAIALGDLPRPETSAGGVTGVQLAAAVAASAVWYWHGRVSPGTKNKA